MKRGANGPPEVPMELVVSSARTPWADSGCTTLETVAAYFWAKMA